MVETVVVIHIGANLWSKEAGGIWRVLGA